MPETTAPVYTLMKQAMLEHEKEYGVKITWNGVLDKGPAHDAALTERQGVQRMLESKIQALIIKPVDAKAAYPILREARRWNVPVISLDQMLVSMPVHGHVTINETVSGKKPHSMHLSKSDIRAMSWFWKRLLKSNPCVKSQLAFIVF